MKLKTILIQVLLLTLTICAQAQNVDGTFTVATMNVDGLPAKILGVSVNEGGPQGTGTTRMSELIAQKGWDFFSVSEDFNYNSSLLTYLGDYSYGKFRGEINFFNMMGMTKFNTDGLNLFWKTAKCSMANESINRNSTAFNDEVFSEEGQKGEVPHKDEGDDGNHKPEDAGAR